MKIFLNRYFIIGVLVLISLISTYRLFRPGYFSMQDDMQVFRLHELDSCLRDGQFPCRFIRDGGMGYGYPLYNYYSPFPYYFAEVLHLFGLSLIDSLKLSFIAPAFIRSFGMYLLSMSFFGPLGGLLSSALYTLAPYQAVDTFVRGAIAEAWALALLPWILWTLYTRRRQLFIATLTALLLSHNLTLVYFLPLLFIFALISKNLKFLIFQGLFAFVLSAFFILPAFFEKNLVTVSTMTQGYFNYINHFATLFELFISRFWGYGASLWGPVDDMSFQIGYAQWLLPAVAVVFLILQKKSKFKKYILLFFLAGIFFLFLTHNRSTFIWKLLPFLAYFQFPWRFLGPAVLCFSFVSGYLSRAFFFKKFPAFIFFLIIIIIGLNFSFFREDRWFPMMVDADKLTPAEVWRQSGAGLKDYWPKGSADFPAAMAPSAPQVVSGQSYNLTFSKNSRTVSGTVSVVSPQAEILVPLVYFPGWQLTLNGQSQPVAVDRQLGLVKLNLNTGITSFNLVFTDTPIRRLANIISLLGLAAFIIKIVREQKI